MVVVLVVTIFFFMASLPGLGSEWMPAACGQKRSLAGRNQPRGPWAKGAQTTSRRFSGKRRRRDLRLRCGGGGRVVGGGLFFFSTLKFRISSRGNSLANFDRWFWVVSGLGSIHVTLVGRWRVDSFSI